MPLYLPVCKMMLINICPTPVHKDVVRIRITESKDEKGCTSAGAAFEDACPKCVTRAMWPPVCFSATSVGFQLSLDKGRACPTV